MNLRNHPRTVLKGFSIANLTSCPDDIPAEVSRQAGDLAEMYKLFEGWDPRLMILLSKVDKALKWKIWVMEELDTWTKVRSFEFVFFVRLLTTLEGIGGASRRRLPPQCSLCCVRSSYGCGGRCSFGSSRRAFRPIRQSQVFSPSADAIVSRYP